MRDVITIGSATFDAFLETDMKFADYPDAPLGKALTLPFGEKISARNAVMTIGGNSVNAAVTFRREGFRVAPCIKIGNDAHGAAIIDRLKKERIDNSLVSPDDLPTSFSAIFLQEGERSIINYKGAGGDLSGADIPFRKMKARWWYVSLSGKSISLLPSIVSYARANDIRVALNPTGWHIEHAKEQLIRCLKKVDFLVLNEGEAAELVGISFNKEKEVFKRLDEITPGVCAVTGGSRGVTVSDGSYIYKAGVFKEKKLIDRTGAGDAFGSGFVAGLMRKREECDRGDIDPENIVYAIRLATANAASAVEVVGGSEGVLFKKEFDREKRWSRLKIVKTKTS